MRQSPSGAGNPSGALEPLPDERPIVVVCDEGFASSLAAASLQDLGLVNATDLEGGYQALKEIGG